MSLWVPPAVSENLIQERLMDTAERLRMVEMDPVCINLTAWVRDFDEKVSIVKARENAHAPGIRPGFYHIMRFNEGAPLSFVPIEDPKDGGFTVPDSNVLDRLRRSDMWNERVVRDRAAVAEREARELQAKEEAERAERVEEITERWAAASQTRVSFNRDTPWTQGVAGKRGAKR